jgi:GNAT superfamily N-acetyltransferase
MDNNWTIRAVEPADGVLICRHRFDAAETPASQTTRYLDWFGQAMQRGTYLGLVAQHDGHVIAGAGLVMLDWGPTRDDQGDLRGRIVNVFTESAWRRRGIAKQLVEGVIRLGEEAGIGTLSLGASKVGEALYLPLGFVRYEEVMVRRG